MRRSQSMLLSWSDRLSMFVSRFQDSQTCGYRLAQARRQIKELKQKYSNRSLCFDYHTETIRGEFVAAIEGDVPGTYMVVLKIASSRLCNGPCFLRVAGTRMSGLAVTGSEGIVGIALAAE